MERAARGYGEGEAGSWASVGMDDADAVLTEEPRQNSPPEGERSAGHVTGRRWEVPLGRSEPPTSAGGESNRRCSFGDLCRSSAGKNEQIDKAMAAMGVSQNLKKEENVVVARGGGSKSVQMGLAHIARQEILAGEPKTKVRYLGCLLNWDMSSATERETRIAAVWNAWHMLGQFWKPQVDFKFKCNVFKATMQGALLSGLCTCAGENGSFAEIELFPLERCQNQLARRLLAMMRRNWDGEPNKQQTMIKVLHRKLGIVSIAMELRIRLLGWAKRVAEQIQDYDVSHQQVLAVFFFFLRQTRLDRQPCMTSHGKLTFEATPWAKQSRDATILCAQCTKT